MGTRIHTATVWPTLLYRDADEAIRFLVQAFGFEELVCYRDDADESVVLHAEVRWPHGGGVSLGTAGSDPMIADLPPGTGRIFILTDAPDGIYQRAVAAGAKVVQEPHDEHWGSREFTVRDPEGVYWCFSTDYDD
jgi:uncharacterized glyoxalase superfamily protein PhnB